jgi:hypothetical protein
MAEPEKPEANETKASADNALPHVESPSISPAEDAPAAEADKPAPGVHALTIFTPRQDDKPKPASGFTFPNYTITIPEIRLSRRTKRRAAMAASVAIAAMFGAATGALAIRNLDREQASVPAVANEETQALQKSLAHMSKELGTLKVSLDSAARTATTQISKVTDRIAKIEQADITASISKPAVVAAAPVQIETPVPQARPAVQPSIVPGWSARAARNGAILVEGRGEVYEVTPGVPLPGLGKVESIKRDGDRWVVATPKGIIVSSNAPPPQQRSRPYYYPPYFRPF